MLRGVLHVAPVAALLAIGVPAPSAKAAGAPVLQPDQGVVLVGEERRGRGRESGDRSERRSRGDGDRDRGARFDRDGDRDRDRRLRRNRDGRDIWYGFRPSYDDCDWLRRRARATDDPYWWRRYRACLRRW
jgi:hypothetical protein